MKIILSPAKKMNIDTDSLATRGEPVFLNDTEKILNWMRKKSKKELKLIWKCNDKLTEENYKKIMNMNLSECNTPAILSYEGIAYQYMAPAVFDKEQLKYIQSHLRILSAFYGVLKPLDRITPYRLEMQAAANVEDSKDLYGFWGDKLYKEVKDDSGIIINLASKEYSKCIKKYLIQGDRFITCDFVEEVAGKLVTKGTYAKMVRGEMVRYMAENNIKEPEEIKNFRGLDYIFREDLSNADKFVFERRK